MTDSPRCEACGSTYLAWQLQPTCLLWRCPRCGHIRRDLDLARAGARSPAYGGDPRADRLRLALTYRRIRAQTGTGAPRDVLEIGSGDGGLLARFADAGDRVVGVEPAASVGSAATVHRSTAEEMPDFDSAFDLVVAIHCLEHVLDLSHVLGKVAAALRPGGTFYALTPNASSEGLRVYGEAWWMLEDPTHRQFLSPSSARRLLGRAGLDRVRTRPVRLDSLGVDAASIARLRHVTRTHGALDSRAVRVGALALLPVSLLARGIRPGFAPTLEIVARRPGRTS